MLESKNYTKEQLLKLETKSDTSRGKTSLFLIINRWIGIESMLAIVSTDKLNFDLFFESLKERKITGNDTFYESTFYIDYDHGKNVMFGEKRILKGNTLPGIITFLFYSGNYYFLFISMFILTLVFCLLEIICLRVSNKNMIFAAFVFAINLFDLGGSDNLVKKGYKVENLMDFPGH